MPTKVRIIPAMKISDVTPEWVKLRAKTKGMRLGDLAKAVGMERTKLSKSLNGKRNFLGWELAKLLEVLDEGHAHAVADPDVIGMLEDYLALSEPDRVRARGLLRALLTAEVLEGKPASPDEPKG
jgi:transcriptional regulator with XRE-family HTH domain